MIYIFSENILKIMLMDTYYSKKDFWLGALLWMPLIAAVGIVL